MSTSRPASSTGATPKKQPPPEEERRSSSRISKNGRGRSRSASSKKTRRPIAGLQAPPCSDTLEDDDDDDRMEPGGPIDLDAFVGATTSTDDDDILDLLEAGQANTVVATATTRQQRRKQQLEEQPPAAPKQQPQAAAAAVLADGFRSSPADDDETTASMVTATAGNTTTTVVMMTGSSSSSKVTAATTTPTTTMTKEETASSENDDNDNHDHDPDDDDDEGIAIPDDVYTLFFVSAVPGLACFYSVYVFALKMTLYTFLAVDTFDFDLYFGAAAAAAIPTASSRIVLAAQFLMIPVAVAMQADLIDSFYLMANAQYDDSTSSSGNRHMRSLPPHATRCKYAASVAARFADGVSSLLVNFVVLLTAETVLALFLNFAALHFLQIVDNTALEMAAKGYLTDQLERDAAAAVSARLPRRPARQTFRRACDTVLFLSTVAVLSAAWGTLYYLHRRDGGNSGGVEEL